MEMEANAFFLVLIGFYKGNNVPIPCFPCKSDLRCGSPRGELIWVWVGVTLPPIITIFM